MASLRAPSLVSGSRCSRTAIVSRASPAPASAPKPTAAQVKAAIEKAHEVHGQGHVLQVQCEGRGKRMCASSRPAVRTVTNSMSMDDVAGSTDGYSIPGM